jgi:hypothetical protein
MIDSAPPPRPSFVIVESAEDRSPLLMLGFVAFGAAQDLERLDSAARERNLSSNRTAADDGSPEQMILFPAGSNRAHALAIYRDARSGRFGPLRVEVVIVPVAAAADGVDFDTEVTAEPPSFIVEPQ